MYFKSMELKHDEICLAHSLRKADRVVSQLYNEMLAPVGIKVTQFSVLRVLHLMGCTTASQVRQVLVMDQTTISRALKPLVRDGYIHVAEGATRREKDLSLSKEGKALYKKALIPWNKAQALLKKRLGTEMESVLIDLTREVAAMKD